MLETSYTDGPENFNMFIKVDGELICHRQFDAKPYPPKVRYSVDIRDLIPTIISNIQDGLNRKTYTEVERTVIN
jgi:hypothetical protein